jgi:hypothetical protein
MIDNCPQEFTIAGREPITDMPLFDQEAEMKTLAFVVGCIGLICLFIAMYMNSKDKF